MKTVISNLKKENKFYFKTLSTITDMLINLKTNVIFCDNCKEVPAGDYEVDQVSIPDTLECELRLQVQDYPEEIRNLNALLAVHGLPDMKLDKQDTC